MLAFTAPAVSAQILTAGDLAQTGVTRLSDILELAENWISSSTEGYHWTIAPLGTSWEASPDWNLFIDGQPIQTQVLNQRSLNVIPVTVAEICEVRLHATPILVHGTLAHGGAIEIFRCTPREGFSIKGQFAAGNETGDPGPYRYTNFGGPNVDRTGPTVHISGAAARQKWFVRITAAADEHHATDPRIRPRVLQLYQGEKDARLFHRSLGVNSQLFGHQIHAGISRMEDLPFVPIMGREIPLNQTIAITSASFFRDRYGYSLVGSSTTFTTRENPDSLLMEGIERRILARAFAVQSILGASQLELGIHASLSEARMDEQLERGRFGSLKVYATLQPDLLYHFYMNAMTAFTLDAGVPGYQLFIQAEHKTSGIEAQLLMRSQALASRVNFSSWVERGHLPHPGTIGVIPLDFEERESMYSADLTWSTGAGLQLSGGVRKFVNWVRPYTEVSSDSSKISIPTFTGLTETTGQVARLSAQMQLPLSSPFGVRIYGSYAYPWSRMHEFRDAWHHRLQLGVRGTFQPNDRFSLSARLRYNGPSTWHEFEEVARENPQFYVMRLPGAVHLHLTSQKRLWGNRLRISATMRNVLAHPHLTHPAGARTRALFQVTLRYAFQMRRTKSL